MIRQQGGLTAVNIKLQHYLASINQKTLARYCAGLLLLLALLAMGLEAYSALQLTKPSTANNTPVKPSKPLSLTNYSAYIVDAALFGSSNATQLSDIELPKTKLQLVLRGAFTASDPSKASAIIEGVDQKAKHYKIGSVLFGQTELKAVYSDRVILSTNDNLETLYFPSSATDSLSSTTTAATEQNNSTQLSDEKRKQLIQQRLQELRKRVSR
ncbi:type II secretion system protein N [Dasania phycosphaerae]|uniref:type II secretion system protein N n=1 Tax=Dasania phycosphaerae TaxID=2950436 RepID=UPI0022A6A20B|nr:type II secretion system protein N [Dasania phycosphaerae]